jgi:PAS domain S-box-containing protein
LLGAAIDQAAESIIITDAEGTIQYVNPSFTRTTGYSRDEAIGQNPRILKSGLQDQFFYQKMWGAISAGRTWEGRLVNRRKDGTQVTELATISPVRAADGRVKHFVAVKRDISEFVRLTEELTQAQKMESIGRLAGGVAHDFNNLITGVMGYAELALARLPEDHPVRDDIKSILKGAERTAGLTRQLLAFARKQTIEPRVIDLNDSISEMTRMLSRLIGEDIKLVWKPGADLWNVLMDPGQVDQLLANLCVNSRDAINGVGEIVITTANVVVGDEECFDEPDASPGKYVVLTIRDNGSGMSEEVARHAFDPFYTTKDIGKGTGLGLSTVFGIVKQNGGFIRLETSPGEGSAFHIHLPRDKGVAIKHGGASCGDRHVSDELRILVVEDDPAVRILLEMILRQCGHKLLSATTPDEAIKLANDHEDAIDLMITDVVMPGMNGRELADRLCPTRPEMRVIFISGYTADLIAKRGIIDDEVAFLSKPFTRDALMAKIDEVMAASPARVDS